MDSAAMTRQMVRAVARSHRVLGRPSPAVASGQNRSSMPRGGVHRLPWHGTAVKIRNAETAGATCFYLARHRLYCSASYRRARTRPAGLPRLRRPARLETQRCPPTDRGTWPADTLPAWTGCISLSASSTAVPGGNATCPEHAGMHPSYDRTPLPTQGALHRLQIVRPPWRASTEH